MNVRIATYNSETGEIVSIISCPRADVERNLRDRPYSAVEIPAGVDPRPATHKVRRGKISEKTALQKAAYEKAQQRPARPLSDAIRQLIAAAEAESPAVCALLRSMNLFPRE